jgi:hypothetical protein
VFPTGVGELVIAAMAIEAENLEYVPTGALVALRGPCIDDLRGFVSGRS